MHGMSKTTRHRHLTPPNALPQKILNVFRLRSNQSASSLLPRESVPVRTYHCPPPMASCGVAFSVNPSWRLLSSSPKRLLCRKACSRPFVRACAARMARMVSTTTSQEGIEVRRARAADVRDVARVVVRAFCEDDAVVRKLRELKLLQQVGALGMVEGMYENLCYMEVLEQLAKRLVEPERKGVLEETAKKHVLLVAIDEEEESVIGCIEMGLVNVPRLLASGMLNEVRQWEENVRKTPLQAQKEAQRKSAGNGNPGALEQTPYIGNLAVSSPYRRLGVGSVLVRSAQRHAMHEWGHKTVCLHVEAGNDGAQRLYANLGFTCEMMEPEWYAEVGKPRRMFLRSGGEEQTRDVGDIVKDWKNSKVVGRKLGPMEYLRFCWWDLGRRRREQEQADNRME